MAFAGLNVNFGYGGASSGRTTGLGIRSKPYASHNMSVGGTSNVSAPGVTVGQGQPIATVDSVADAWVAFGAAPDATVSPRFLVKAGVREDFYVESGDKLHWVLA